MSLIQILFHKPILLVLEKHLTLKDIVLLSSTCRLLKKKWFSSAPLRIGERIKEFFNWDSLSIGPIKTYYKRLKDGVFCIGGCGKSCTYLQTVSICKSAMCTSCFMKKGDEIIPYMKSRGYLILDEVVADHMARAKQVVAYAFGKDVHNVFFSESSDYREFSIIDRCYRLTTMRIKGHSYVLLSHDQVEKIVIDDLATIKERVRSCIKSSYENAKESASFHKMKFREALRKKKRRKIMFKSVQF